MRKFIPTNIYIILQCIILSLLSCTPESCLEETQSFLKASFYSGEETVKLTAPDSLSLYGLNRDSIIYDNKTGVQPALIPLNASTESSKFIIIINGVTDTVEFRYSSYPHLISKECGYTFYHHLDTAPVHTKHLIDTIYLSNETITTLNVENIRIFY